MRRHRRYPRQSVIPSQSSPHGPAFFPLVQADMLQKSGTVFGEIGYVKPEPYVLTQYDARPINCVDFVHTLTPQTVAADEITFTHAVPPGRTAVYRNLALRVYMSAAARDAVTAEPTAEITMDFAIDGVPVDQFNSLRVDDAICGLIGAAGALWQEALQIPLYFLAPENSSVTLTISNATAAIDLAFVAPVIHGNLLLTEGVNPTSEPGTKSALPVFASWRQALPIVGETTAQAEE